MADYIEFKAPEIGINRAKKVAPTNKIIRKVLALELTQAKVVAMDMNSDPETIDEAEERVNGMLKYMDDTEDFLATTLGLSKKQKDSLEDLTQNGLANLSMRLQSELLRVNPDEPDTDKEDEPDPK